MKTFERVISAGVGLTMLLVSQNAAAHIPGGHSGAKPSIHPVSGPIRPNASPLVPDSDPLLRRPFGIRSVNEGLNAKIRVEPIYWGTQWSDPGFAGDRISGLDDFYSGLNASSYLAALLEYMPTTMVSLNQGPSARVPGDFPVHVTLPKARAVVQMPSLIYGGDVFDDSPVPVLGVMDPTVDWSTDDADYSRAEEEVSRLLEAGKVELQKGVMNYFPVYVDQPRPASVDACAEHSADLYQGVLFAVALFYNTDTDPLCVVNDTRTGHSEALAELANTSARAIAEVFTDSSFDGWSDEAGNEVDDKCDSVFIGKSVLLTNGTEWRLQSFWSNSAFLKGSGAPNIDGMPGCIDSSAVSTGKGAAGGGVKGNSGARSANVIHY